MEYNDLGIVHLLTATSFAYVVSITFHFLGSAAQRDECLGSEGGAGTRQSRPPGAFHDRRSKSGLKEDVGIHRLRACHEDEAHGLFEKAVGFIFKT